MRHALRPTLALIVLAAGGCGTAQVVPPAPPPAAPASPAPAPAPAAPPAPAPAPTATAPAAAAPVLLDLASPDLPKRLQASGQDDARARVVQEDGKPALEFACAAGPGWPGLAILPEHGSWDLSASGGVAMTIANAGTIPAEVSLRVDQQGGPPNAWNGETAKLAPGASATIRVHFGFSWGKPGAAVDPARIGRLLVYAAKPGEGCVLHIRSLAAAGKPGDKPGTATPKAIVTRRAPCVPEVLSFAGGLDRARLQPAGATLTAAGEAGRQAAAIEAVPGAAKTELVWRPVKPVDLRDFDQAVFAVRNPGIAPVRVACRLQGVAADDRVSIEAEIPAGGRREILLPFASGAVWQGVTPAAADAPPGNKPFLGAPLEQSSTGLVNDAVTAAAVAIVQPAAGARIEWEGVTAGVSPLAVPPEWIGTRPPADGDWVRVYADEFDGAALDTTHWTPRLPWIGPIPWELQRYNDRNVSVHDGHLVIHCEKQTGHLYDNPAWPERDYTTGAVTTHDKWTWHYGYAEARMRLPRALGLWPAFWTMPDRGATRPDGTARTKGERRDTTGDGMEFDIMEHVTRFGPFRYNIAGHWDGYGKDHRSVGTSRTYSRADADGWIVSGLLWEPGRLSWYCNGRKIGTWADPRVGSAPATLKFTVQMGGWAGNEVDDSALPADFEIDWVRVWQLRERLAPPSQP